MPEPSAWLVRYSNASGVRQNLSGTLTPVASARTWCELTDGREALRLIAARPDTSHLP
jgi:hypothetical protein